MRPRPLTVRVTRDTLRCTLQEEKATGVCLYSASIVRPRVMAEAAEEIRSL